MKKLIAIAAMALSLSAFAAVEVNTSGLTDAQKAELVKQAEAMKMTSTPEAQLVEKVDKWVDVGEKVGKMMGGAAKEVGIAVNDFVKTPVGLMTAGIILWNYMGGMIIHVVAGAIFFVVSFSLLTYMMRRCALVKITYDKDAGKNWLGRYAVLKVERDGLSESEQVGLLLGYAIATGITCFITFSW